MDGKNLTKQIQTAVNNGTVTTFKKLEEELKVSRTTIQRMINDGKYAAVKIKNQWILIKQ